jgi:hypothetical protein
MKHNKNLATEDWHVAAMDDRHNPDGEGWEIIDGCGRIATVYGDEAYHREQAELIADAPRLLSDLASEREKVRVLRGVLEHVAATVDAAIYAENSDDDYNLKNAARKTAEAALAATEPGKTDD